MKKRILSFLKVFVALCVVVVFVVSVSGCAKEEGPMEKVGKQIDQAVDTAKDKVDQAAKDVKEGVDKTTEAVKEGAEKTKDAVKDAAK